MSDVVLKTLAEKHIEKTWRWVNRPELAQLIGTVYPVPWAGHVKWFRALKKDPQRKHFAIELAGGKHIGNTGIKLLDPENRSAELFIYIGDPAERGRGCGAEATRKLVGLCFGKMGLRRVSVTVFAYNRAALKLYRRAGFEKEAVMREHLYRGGLYHDIILLSALTTW